MSFGFDKVVSDYIGLSTLTEQSFCPGIETELFYKEGAYDYSIWDEREDIPAIWGNQIPDPNTEHIRVMCPYVYAKLLTDNEILVEKNDVLFLPRSDWGWVDLLVNPDDFYEKIYDICDSNTILISWPRDINYWKSLLPGAKIFTVGRHRYEDTNWTYNLIKLIKRSKKLYFTSFGSASVLAAMYNKDIEFYDSGEVYDPQDGAQYSPHHQTKRWNDAIDHFKNVISQKEMTEDKKYLIYNFLSINNYQTPEQLKESIDNRKSGPYSECEKLNEYIPISPSKETVEIYESLRIFQDQSRKS